MRVVESRRITGRHPLIPRPGAAAEVTFEPGEDAEAALARFAERARILSRHLGWGEPITATSRHVGGATVAMTAPRDRLLAACEALERASSGDPLDDAALAAVRALESGEANPRLLQCYAEAKARDIPAFDDEDGFTFGLGVHSRTWPLSTLPSAAELGTVPAGRIPFVLVTGTNGKTTTTRLLARAAEEAGHRSGHTSSDGIRVGGEWLERGDWTGPGAARALLRDPRVTYAVLETARGGMLRRGLVLDGADAAAVTNVSDDHFGEWGIDDRAGMARVKLHVAAGVREGGWLVLNAEDPSLAAGAAAVRARRPDLRIAWFSAGGAGTSRVQEPLGAWVEGGVLRLREAGGAAAIPLVPVAAIPIALSGFARHNVENALAAALLASRTGIAAPTIAAALRGFRPSPEESRGRSNLFDVGGAAALVDFAHNSAGMDHVVDLASRWPAMRRLVILSHAGDRTDALIEDYARRAARLSPDRVILKELPDHLRGRIPGEIPALLRRHLVDAGLPESRIEDVPDEVEAARRALTWSRPGDLLLLLVHERLDEVLEVLREAGAREWGEAEGGEARGREGA